MKKIQPVITYVGSKYRMLDKIFKLLDLKKDDIFLDMFGGSGIVGVNARHLYKCKVIINDYDEIMNHNRFRYNIENYDINNFYLEKEKCINNLLSFDGLGKNYTKERLNAFISRYNNG